MAKLVEDKLRMNKGKGRLTPSDFSHVTKRPFGGSVAAPRAMIAHVEKTLILPSWHTKHDQGQTSSCVGHGESMMLSIMNEYQVRRQGQRNPYIRYNPYWLWDQAKETDEWPETNPGDENGTSLHAAAEVLKSQGHVLWDNEDDPKSVGDASPDFGIAEVRWATTVDEIRTAIALDLPVAIGTNWYNGFDKPELYSGEYWIGRSGDIGQNGGGHCTCIYGASDTRQAARIKNSWGVIYPEVWLDYNMLNRLLHEAGEAALITDR